jgi:HlyB family type I secretion system ABC transporter
MNSSSSLRVQGEQNYPMIQHPTTSVTILKLLRLLALDTSLASDFSQAWGVREFQLGDDLTSYIPYGEADKGNVVYLVCHGRVRLLGFDPTTGREVSTQILLTEQIFGADHLFYSAPAFAYRAIAASAGFLATIPVAELKLWLGKLPNLENYLQKKAYERQAVIFFKICTELRSQSSFTLQQLLPYIIETTIAAGSELREVTSAAIGRFWLVGGKIQSRSQDRPPIVGESWGYPEIAVADWFAETDLLLYHLPIEHWELASAIAPKVRQPRDDEKKISFPNPSHPEPEPSRTRAKFCRRSGFIQQQSSSDCGAACLVMVSQYWGKRFSLNTVRNLAQIDRMGASLEGLGIAAENLGYKALPVRASLTKVELHNNPWIAHWQASHYVVVWQVKGSNVLISDPAIGKRSLSRQEFEANWTGYALLLEPTAQLDAIKSEQISFTRFWLSFWQYRKLIGQIILASVLLNVFALVTPLYTQVVLDQVLPEKNDITLNIFAISFLIFGIWRMALKSVRQYLLDYFSSRMDRTFIGDFTSHTLRLPLPFFTSRQVGDIISRVQENRKIQLFLTRQAVVATLDALFVVVYLGVMAYYNLRLTILLVCSIIPIALLTLTASPFLKRVSRSLAQESALANSSMVEMVTGIATVKTAAVETPLGWRWEERFRNMLFTRLLLQRLANNLQFATSLINHLATTAILWYGATLVMGGLLSIGQFVAFNLLISNVINPILGLVGLWDEFQEVLISVERLNDVWDTEPEENPQKPLLPTIRGEVHFENVSFRYNQEQERNTLQNINFRVKAGQTIGIVGFSGSGKSTLVNLLAGLYRPNTGRVLIDGHDIADVSPQSLRSQLGVVPQECFLFSGSILENITLWCPELTPDRAIAAAKLADAHEFIQALPFGYNTLVGERGMTLSGGQRQRIAIARAIIKNPRILILDEATSSLDTESERRFQQNISRLCHLNTTTLLIAHRLKSVLDADRILVIDRGILVEQGTHQELIAIRGLYYHLAQQQLHL